ncbi:MAG: P-type ATPase [Chitinophagaceae bacterium]|nr:MAG: P-type ATPase [Chitinophagaceae bacterium]
MNKIVENNTACYHCGDACSSGSTILFNEKPFCCSGCKTVYQILNKSDLCDYYSFNAEAGVKVNENRDATKFAFLDNPTIAATFITFANQQQTAVKFYLPQIHCSSCLWLLENLHKLNPSIFFSSVNFPAKEVTVHFDQFKLSVRELAELLASIGYEPHITLDSDNHTVNDQKMLSRKALVKIGIAGFCFANIMMLSFPEYLGLETLARDGLSPVMFRAINLVLSIPVLLYCGAEFFVNSWYGFKQKMLNIDAPIALALIVTFARSVYEIVSGTGAGYLDSMTGIIFFMLLGRAFQTKTFANLKFNRDFKAYFPIAVCKLNEAGEEIFLPVNEISVDDKIRIRNNEVIPFDGILINGKAEIDYSFVTGENEPNTVKISEIVYAGGKQTNGAIELLVIKPFSQSNFTRLWNNEAFKKEEKNGYTFTGIISNYFAVVVLIIAAAAFIYWMNINPKNAWNAMTAVLIVACPCALLLTTTFTQGFLLNIFSNKGMYLKNANILQTIPFINHIVFDKTGTLTYPNISTVQYEGSPLNAADEMVFAAMFAQSLHPLSKSIAHSMQANQLVLEHIKEVAGSGIEAWENETHYKAGSAAFVGSSAPNKTGSEVWISINDKVYGKYEVANLLREHVDVMINSLPYAVSILSGDNSRTEAYLQEHFNQKVVYHFNQTPENKLAFIASLQNQQETVMMVGDGLNDAGALSKSNIGLAVVDNTIQFSPASDAIILAKNLPYLNQYIKAAILSKRLITITFIISLIYNVLGIYFSVTAQLSPIVAAVLMPMSTLSIVSTTLIGSIYIDRFCFKLFNQPNTI